MTLVVANVIFISMFDKTEVQPFMKIKISPFSVKDFHCDIGGDNIHFYLKKNPVNQGLPDLQYLLICFIQAQFSG